MDRPKCWVLNNTAQRVPLEGLLNGSPAFLIASGPSLNDLNLDLLNQRGIVTMGLNNSPAVFRPNFWTFVDSPTNFLEHIWQDPQIIKFAPEGHKGARLSCRNEDGAIIPSSQTVLDSPSVLYYRRNAKYSSSSFLKEETFNWGNSEKEVDEFGHAGSRSVFLVALKLLWWLGAGEIYLLGADFKMSVDQTNNYAFPQYRSSGSIRNNNRTYKILNDRLSAIRPAMEASGCRVYNCYEDSALKSFDYLPFEEAVMRATGKCSKPIVTENMYEVKPMKIKLLYTRAFTDKTDINQHIELLSRLASLCDSVTEMGTHLGSSTAAFAFGRPKVVNTYDKTPSPVFKEVQEAAKEIGVNVRHFVNDSQETDIPETDLLFIDTPHTYSRMKADLNKHASKAKKYIVLHDTTTYGDNGEGKEEGVWRAIAEFLKANSDWRLQMYLTNNHGLTVLEKK